MSSYRKKDKQEQDSNPNLRKAIPGVSADNYDAAEGLAEFLFGLEPMVEYVQVGELFADIFATENELYFRIYDYTYGHVDSMFGSCTDTYVLRDLQKNYIDQILQSKDELELVVNHVKDEQVVQTKIKITGTGEIIGKRVNAEVVPAPYGRLLAVLKNPGHQLMWKHPDYFTYTINWWRIRKIYCRQSRMMSPSSIRPHVIWS